MLVGEKVTLRPVLEKDLDTLYDFHIQVDNRGSYYPRSILSQPVFRKQFQEDGFWSKDEGTLLIVDSAGTILGHIEFFKTVNYLDEYELSYRIYDPAQRGKGYMSEALRMMVRYLFETKQVNRIRLMIHPENAPSRRLAEKCGFKFEGIARGAWYNNGRHHDLTVYAILHDEVIAPGG